MAWPTSQNPKIDFVTCRFPADEAAELDSAANAANQSRSAFVRDSVRRVIASEKRKAARLTGKVVATGEMAQDDGR